MVASFYKAQYEHIKQDAVGEHICLFQIPTKMCLPKITKKHWMKSAKDITKRVTFLWNTV